MTDLTRRCVLQGTGATIMALGAGLLPHAATAQEDGLIKPPRRKAI